MFKSIIQICRVLLFSVLLLFSFITCSPVAELNQPVFQTTSTVTDQPTSILFKATTPPSAPCSTTIVTQTPIRATPRSAAPPRLRPTEPVHVVITPTAPEANVGAAPLSDLDSSKYQLSARIDYEAHQAVVSQKVHYLNRTSSGLSELAFVVEPNRHDSGFRLLHLAWTDGTPIDDFMLDGAQLSIPLLDTLLPHESISLLMSYEMSIPNKPGPFGYDERQTNLGDWYPYIPPYQPESGWLINESGSVGEHLVYDTADFEVRIELAEYDGDLVVAASAPAIQNGRWQEFKAESVRNFVLSISHDYQVATSTVNSVVVTSYFYPENNLAGVAALDASAGALQVFSEQLVGYSRPGLSVVEAGFHDGMEYDGLFFLDQELYTNYTGNPEGYLTAIAAHETAHQWWYGIVANNQALEPWLDEALATYSELLFYETLHPQSADWWWDVRILRFDPGGNVGDTIYDHDNFRSYVNTVYLNGALFIDEIRRSLGDAEFFAFLRDYLSTYKHQVVGANDFWATLRGYDFEGVPMLKKKYFSRR